jgi:hypothetical protein
MHHVGALREDSYRKGLKGTDEYRDCQLRERDTVNGGRWTYCSRAARERGLPLRLLGSERRAVVLAGARGYTCVGSRQKSRTHLRLQTIDRRARRREWSTGILEGWGGGRRTLLYKVKCYIGFCTQGALKWIRKKKKKGGEGRGSLKHVRRTSQSIAPSLGRDRRT